MRNYVVGEKYPDLVSSDLIKFDMTDNGPLLYMIFNNPNAAERESMVNGSVNLKVAKVESIIFLLIKVGSLQWMDAPFHVRLSQATHYEMPEGEQRYAVTAVMADGATGEVLRINLVAMTPKTSRKLYEYMLEQTEGEFDRGSYDRALGTAFNNYSTSDLVKRGF